MKYVNRLLENLAVSQKVPLISNEITPSQISNHLLSWGCGVGKSHPIIYFSMLCSLSQKYLCDKKNVLVVSPSFVLHSWVQKIREHQFGMEAHFVVLSSQNDVKKLAKIKHFRRGKLIITTYGVFENLIKKMKAGKDCTLISQIFTTICAVAYDEIHQVCQKGATKFGALMYAQGNVFQKETLHIGITGTQLRNDEGIFNLLKFLSGKSYSAEYPVALSKYFSEKASWEEIKEPIKAIRTELGKIAVHQRLSLPCSLVIPVVILPLSENQR